jgi:protein-disulfide isomerase
MEFVASPALSSNAAPPFASYLVQRFAFLTAISVFVLLTMGVTTPTFGQNADVIVATLEGKAITQSEVDDTIASKLVPLQQQLYALRKVALDNLITSKLLENEAARRKLSVEELRKTMGLGSVNVTRDQVELAYSQNATFFAAMSPDEAKERLRLDLESQQRMKHYRAALESLRKSSSLVVNLSPPPFTMVLTDGLVPALGSKTSPITIVEFSDFECPFCKRVQPTLKEVLQEYADRIRFVFRNLPSEGHRNALPAARAAFCAGQQDRFWQYRDALFASDQLTDKTLKKLALDLGLNQERFHACISSEESLNAITRDVELAQRFKIGSTPSFVINGQMISGAISVADFRRIIEKELRLLGSAKASSTN